MKIHIAVAAVFVATAFTSLAQTVGTLELKGSVVDRTSIDVAPQGKYEALPIEDGCTDEVVAEVTETSNNRTGYTVTLRSANAGSGSQATLKGTGANTDTVGYSMKYGGTSVTLVAGIATVTNASARTAKTGEAKSLTVTIPESWVTEDTYSDTLTLTIAAK